MDKVKTKKKVVEVITSFLGEQKEGSYDPVYFDDYDVDILSEAIAEALAKE